MSADYLAPDCPRNWTEDADHENGRYLCRCTTCKQPFIGHKRRVTCKVCADRDSAVAAERGAWLHEHNAPKDWVIYTLAEIQRMHAEWSDLLLQLNVERNLRRELAAAFDRLADCISETRGKNAYYALEDGRETVAKSEKLDAELAAKQAAAMTPATSP